MGLLRQLRARMGCGCCPRLLEPRPTKRSGSRDSVLASSNDLFFPRTMQPALGAIMRRRDFITLLGGAGAAWPNAGNAQQRPARIGILLLGRRVATKDLAITVELARIGYVDGRNVTYEIRVAEGDMRKVPALARELVATKPDVLICATGEAAELLATETGKIPIVVTVTVDPISNGLSTSMSRPSRNITGFTSSAPTLAAKRLELLRDLIPGLRRIAYLGGPTSARYAGPEQREVLKAANALGIAAYLVPVTTVASVTEAFLIIDRKTAQAVMVGSNPFNVQIIGHIIDECSIRDLPAIYPWSFAVSSGGLISYGPASIENYAGTARYVDRLLKGAKVSELPFQDPTEYKLAINQRTARAMKITIPETLLTRADEVID
jgi:putative ABC transport system substrate-binding protein